jgi:hypothetical protein
LKALGRIEGNWGLVEAFWLPSEGAARLRPGEHCSRLHRWYRCTPLHVTCHDRPLAAWLSSHNHPAGRDADVGTERTPPTHLCKRRLPAPPARAQQSILSSTLCRLAAAWSAALHVTVTHCGPQREHQSQLPLPPWHSFGAELGEGEGGGVEHRRPSPLPRPAPSAWHTCSSQPSAHWSACRLSEWSAAAFRCDVCNST